MAVAREPASTFQPAPEGLHLAVCCDEIDLGEVATPWGSVPMAELRWLLEAVNPDTGRRFEVRRRYRLSLHRKANLRRDLELWRGRGFSSEELKGFDLERVVGIPCQVQVQHHASDDGEAVYANVTAVLPAPPGQEVRPPTNYVRVRDRERSQATQPKVSDVPF